MSGILWILGISESIFDLWQFFVSVLGNKDLILGLWWLILRLLESSFSLVVDFGPTELFLGLCEFILGVW